MYMCIYLYIYIYIYTHTYVWLFHRTPKGDPKRGIWPKENINKYRLSHLKVTCFPDPPVRIPLRGTVTV